MSEFAFLLRLQEVYHLTANEAILYFALLRETRKEAKTYIIAQLCNWCRGKSLDTIRRMLKRLNDIDLLDCEQISHGTYRIAALDPKLVYISGDEADGMEDLSDSDRIETIETNSIQTTQRQKCGFNGKNAASAAKMPLQRQKCGFSGKNAVEYPSSAPVLEKEENEEKERSKEKEEKEERGGGGSKLKMESKIDLKTTTTTFSLKNNFNTWWCNYGMTEWQAQYDQCLDFWSHLSDDERRRIMDHTAAFATSNLKKPPNKRKEPYYYLCRDKLWRNDLSTVQAELKVYSGHEAEEAKRRGLELWSCRLPSGRYGLVSVADAERLGLEKKWKL